MVTVIENAFSRDGVYNMVFTTAIEGGINYWADVIDYEWSDHSTDCNMIREFNGVIVDRGENAQHKITRATITKGIRLAYAYSRTWENTRGYQAQALKDLNFGLWEDVDFDADTADIIVQFGLFGELIYG